MRAPRSSACCSSSRITIPAPSPITKPSRVASNGREAVSGESLRSESAVMLAKPPIAIGVTGASAPPLIMMSASPYWIERKGSPVAGALVGQAGAGAWVGARGARRVVGTARIEAHRDDARRDVGDEHRDEEGTDLARPALAVDVVLF